LRRSGPGDTKRGSPKVRGVLQKSRRKNEKEAGKGSNIGCKKTPPIRGAHQET